MSKETPTTPHAGNATTAGQYVESHLTSKRIDRLATPYQYDRALAGGSDSGALCVDATVLREEWADAFEDIYRPIRARAKRAARSHKLRNRKPLRQYTPGPRHNNRVYRNNNTGAGVDVFEVIDTDVVSGEVCIDHIDAVPVITTGPGGSKEDEIRPPEITKIIDLTGDDETPTQIIYDLTDEEILANLDLIDAAVARKLAADY